MNKNIINEMSLEMPAATVKAKSKKKLISSDKILSMKKFEYTVNAGKVTRTKDDARNDNSNIAHVCRILAAFAEKSINKVKDKDKFGNLLLLSAKYAPVLQKIKDEKTGKYVKTDKYLTSQKTGKKLILFQQTLESIKGHLIYRKGECRAVNEKWINILNSVVYKQSEYSWFFAINEFQNRYRRLIELASVRALYAEDMILRLNFNNKDIENLFPVMPTFLSITSIAKDENNKDIGYKTQAIWLFSKPEAISNAKNCPAHIVLKGESAVREYNIKYWKQYQKLTANIFGVNERGSMLCQIYRIPGSHNTKHADYFQVQQLLPEPLQIDSINQLTDADIENMCGCICDTDYADEYDSHYGEEVPADFKRPSIEEIKQIEKEKFVEIKSEIETSNSAVLKEFEKQKPVYYASWTLRRWVLLTHIKQKKYYNDDITAKLEKCAKHWVLENMLGFETAKERFIGKDGKTVDISRIEMSIAKALAATKQFSKDEIEYILQHSPVAVSPERIKTKGVVYYDDTVEKALKQTVAKPDDTKNSEYQIMRLSSAIDKHKEERGLTGNVPQVFFEYTKLFFAPERVASVEIAEHTVFSRILSAKKEEIETKKFEDLRMTKTDGLFLFQMLALADADGHYRERTETVIEQYTGSEMQLHRLIEKMRLIEFSCEYLYEKKYKVEQSKIFKEIGTDSSRDGFFEFKLSKDFMGLYQIDERLKELGLNVFQALKNAKERYTAQLYFFTLFHLYGWQGYRSPKVFNDVIQFFDHIGINTKGLKQDTMRKHIERIRASFRELNDLNVFDMKVQIEIDRKRCLIAKHPSIPEQPSLPGHTTIKPNRNKKKK